MDFLRNVLLFPYGKHSKQITVPMMCVQPQAAVALPAACAPCTMMSVKKQILLIAIRTYRSLELIHATLIEPVVPDQLRQLQCLGVHDFLINSYN